MPKVSVIIPIYNTEKYLRKCLESVCNQTLSDIEIICIDDCSTDNSLNILKEYASKDKRIKLIEFKENKGAAVARNTGIKEAQGEYIGFVDSDDYIDLDFYEKLYTKASETSAEVVKGADYKLIQYDGSVEIDKQNDKIKKNKLNFWSQFTTAIYKTKLIVDNKIDFPIGLLVGEDPVFAMKTAILSKNIQVIDDAQYYYVRRENSLNSHYWSERKIADYCRHLEIIAEFANDKIANSDDKILFFNRLINDLAGNKEARAYKQKLEKYFDDTAEKLRHLSFKYPIKLLFDAHVFLDALHYAGARRGLYWVSINLLKKFLEDKQFDVTLWIKNFSGTQELANLKKMYNLPVEYENIMLGKAANYKKLENKNFNKLNYDAYFNAAHYAQLLSNFKPVTFNVLHDTIPCLDTKWCPIEHSAFFYKFHRQLNEYSYCFCISESCKNDFIHYFYNINPENLFIAPDSTANEFVPLYDKKLLEKALKKYDLNGYSENKYIFYMGSVDDPRKNLLFNIECFLNFIQKYDIKDLYFYLAGSGKEKLTDILKSKLGELYTQHSKYVVPLGYVDDEDVNVLYSNSLFFSFLSLYEGFGMPPLEAMQAGTPVVCADNSSLPEVVGDAAILVNAEDEDGIIEAFRVMYFDETKRNEYIKKGLERAKLFSWDKTYKIISDKMIEIISGKKDV